MATFKESRTFTRVDLSLAQRCVAQEGPILIGLGAYEKVTVLGSTVGGTAWSTAVVTVKLSNRADGPYTAVPGGSITLTAEGLTTQIDVSAYQYLILETTTAQASVVADFAICGFGRK